MNCYCEEIVSYYQEMKKKIVQSIIFVDNVKNTRKIKKKKKNRFQYFPDNMLWSCGLKATEHLLLTKWFYISCVGIYSYNIHISSVQYDFLWVFMFKIVTKGTSINDVPHFLVIFDLPTYLVLLYNVPFLGQFWPPLPTLKRDVINGRSLKDTTYKVNPKTN